MSTVGERRERAKHLPSNPTERRPSVRIRFPLLVATGLLGASASPAVAAVPHTVVPGETLWSIAAANNFTTRSLAAANGLSEEAQVVIGSTIQIPSEAEAAAALAAAGVLPGQPGEVAAQPRAGDGEPGADAPESVVPDDALNLDPDSSVHPHPTNERVTAEQVGSIAQPQGVSPSLAKAVAWQESGFNNAAVSSTGARGVMQIMPPTWDWIDEKLARTPLHPASAPENVRAGTMYLNYLRRVTGDERLALASYYQGLDSVRKDGLLPETERYVASVLAHRQELFGGP